MATTITGTLTARGGPALTGSSVGGDGRIRLEALTNSFTGSLNNTPVVRALSFTVALAINPPASVRVASVAGIPINANPFIFPDVAINTASPVVVSIEARFVPLGAVAKLYIFSETGPDQVINCSPLAGTLALSTATASITFPVGGLLDRCTASYKAGKPARCGGHPQRHSRCDIILIPYFICALPCVLACC